MPSSSDILPGFDTMLPTPSSSLIGREREVAFTVGLLNRDDVRIVTLTGPGGIGKSRLSLDVAEALRPSFSDGLRHVSLAAVSHSGLVATTVARAITTTGPGTAGHSGSPMGIPDDIELLLVLDNFEHVVTAAPFLTDLLGACPHMKALVTSRSPLRISGEHTFPVPPLSVPHQAQSASIAKIEASPAVQLFVKRAQAVNPSFVLDESNASNVAAICRHLDGLPLSIELAAAQSNVLPPATLLARVESGMHLPLPGPRDAPKRHRTTRDAIAWSYDLLSAQDQQVFRYISVFVGGFDLDAAEAVCREPTNPASREAPPTSPDLLDSLASLVESSLVQQAEWEGNPRFSLLETIRGFAHEQLVAQVEDETAQAAHSAWFLSRAEESWWAWLLPEGEQQLPYLEINHPNLLAALNYYLEGKDMNRLIRLATALTGFWYTYTYDHVSTMWLTRALEYALPAPSILRGRLHVSLGMVLFARDEANQAMDLLSSGVLLLKESDDIATITVAEIWQGAIAQYLGEFDQAGSVLTNALKLARRIKAPKLRAALTARALSNLGLVANRRGNSALAIRRYDAALRIYTIEGSLPGMIRALADRGAIAYEQGDFSGSIAYFRQCLDIPGAHTDRRLFAEVLEWTALTAAAWNQPTHAARLLGASASIGTPFGEPVTRRRIQDIRGRVLEAIHGQMSQAAIRRAMVSGRKMSIDQILTEVRTLAPSVSSANTEASEAIKLSRREHEVIRLLAAGHPNRDIARALFLSVRTVEAHVMHIYRKLGVKTRTAAVAVAIANGLADADPVSDSER